MLTRRDFSVFLLAAPVLGLSNATEAKELNFLLKKQPKKQLSTEEKAKLAKAVLDFLEDHYKGMSLAFWQKPFEQIDFEKRIVNIIHWIDIAIQKHQSLYSVDPIWVLSQIKAESLFCELAISDSLAAGICQFLPSTATNGYQMIVAGSLPSHKQAPYVKTELADSLIEFRQLVKERNKYRKETKHLAPLDLKQALNWLATGKAGRKEAQAQLDRNNKINSFNKKVRTARNNYRTYIESNVETLGKNNIFTHQDFFIGFDERFTYKKPIHAMVHMLANALRVRNGNVLAASAAYNAGLRRTWTNESIYTRYGFIPSFEETSRYVSRIVANYEEISKRYYG